MILLSAGHHPQAQGATYNGVSEHSLAVPWCEAIAKHLHSVGEDVALVPTGPLAGKIAWINGQPQARLAVELHFNSDESRRQGGVETLYCPGSVRGRSVAQSIHEEYAPLFPPDRGVKEGWFRMIRPPDPKAVPDAFLSETNPVAVILEPEFIYNLTALADRQAAAIDAIARGLIAANRFLQGGSA